MKKSIILIFAVALMIVFMLFTTNIVASAAAPPVIETPIFGTLEGKEVIKTYPKSIYSPFEIFNSGYYFTEKDYIEGKEEIEYADYMQRLMEKEYKLYSCNGYYVMHGRYYGNVYTITLRNVFDMSKIKALEYEKIGTEKWKRNTKKNRISRKLWNIFYIYVSEC